MTSSVWNKFVCMILIVGCVSGQFESPYQVSIRLKPQVGNTDGVHLCNGAIISENYILTTAECMHFQVVGAMSMPILPAMISVLAGNISDSGNSKIVRTVNSIELTPSYDPMSVENDLALLKINESLPLINRTDVKWVVLDTDNNYRNSCLASFFNPWQSTMRLFLPTQKLWVANSQSCNGSGNYTLAKREDVCSFYNASAGTICGISTIDLKTSGDRGTPLICDSRLVGLLSTIIPLPVNSSLPNCIENRQLMAYYTRISKYTNWIFAKIGTVITSSVNGTRNENQTALAQPPPFQALPVEINTIDRKGGKSGASQRIAPASIVLTTILIISRKFL